jgi:FixJ family two-component response regulator
MGSRPTPINEDPRPRAPVVHVVDDDAAFRTAISDLLRACDYRVELHSLPTDLLEKPPGDEPACILLDVQMAGCSGPQLQERLAASGNKLPVIFLTGHGDIPTSVRTIKAGAEDFLTKPIDKAHLLEAIERALMHRDEARKRDARDAALRLTMARLTEREFDVFALLARGKPHKQIAYALGISERTVKFHRRNVLQKFGVRSLAALAIAADRLGLLSESKN